MTPLLHVAGLAVGFGGAPVLAGLDLVVEAGETVALVGESGSGKTVAALSILRLLPRAGRVQAGRIAFEGEDVMAMSPRRLTRLRGGQAALLFQQPRAMLDPTATVGSQVAEALALHCGLQGAAARARVVELFRAVGIPDPAARVRAYAHQLSDGTAQRVMIAAALAGNPRLLIADEPTSALDVTVQLQILRLLARERAARGLATLLISHDMGVVSALADRIVVLRAGRVVETGSRHQVLRTPRHAETRAMLRAALLRPADPAPPPGPPLATLREVGTQHGLGRGRALRVLDRVSLDIREGEVLGLVGESGCGKSTLARVLLRTVPTSEGSVEVMGHTYDRMTPSSLRDLYYKVQLVFQDPPGALDPRMRLGSSLAAALAGEGAGQKAAVLAMMRRVCLDPALYDRLPRECSGGQLQRAVIARALLMRPRLLVCDEPTSALDASIRVQVLALLRRLRDEDGLTMLMISHDLRVIRHVSDRVAVMHLGELVEVADATALFARPAHPYTQALLAASLLEEHGLDAAAGHVQGDPPSPLAPPPGCRFHTRCRLSDARCRMEHPPLVDAMPGHAVRCWHWRAALAEDAFRPSR